MREIAASKAEQELDRFIAAFEAAQHDSGCADLSDFLPDRADPLFPQVLRELVRVDLEFTWARGQGRRLDHYRRKFPELFDDLQNASDICFEEFRLRRQAGDKVSAEEYQRRYGIETQVWTALEAPPSRAAFDADRLRDLAKSFPSLSESVASPAHANGRSPVVAMPGAGETVLGFQLVRELGRGAFATVFLARQGSLADRFVTLKISRARIDESGILARLQHTNIVPVYSVHRYGPFQVICMPFYGATTAADLIQAFRGQHGLPASGKALVQTLSGRRNATRDGNFDVASGASAPPAAATHMSVDAGDDHATAHAFEPACLKAISGLTYVEAVLWIAARAAEGLHHAHQRGILHCDLKPANVLLADDGQPMLLDFNLSEAMRPDTGPAAGRIGGTLPYMAPENLRAYLTGTRTGGLRSDIYSLGVIIYELLSARLPFPVYCGREDDVLARMLADRQHPPPRLRRWNIAVTPAGEAIVQKCLAADPADRYASADELREDLERQLKHQPLRFARDPSWRERARKWTRRHPRLSSASGIATLAVAVVAVLAIGLAFRGARLARLEAADNLAQFQKEMRSVQTQTLDAATAGHAGLAAAAQLAEHALHRFGADDHTAWQEMPQFRSLSPELQVRAREDIGELLFLAAAIEGLMADAAEQSVSHGEHLDRAIALNRQAETCYAPGKIPGLLWQQRALFAQELGHADEARADLAKAAERTPQTSRDDGMAACLLMSQRRFRTALPLWQMASSRDPQNVWAWYGLGYCCDQLSLAGRAAACYTACIALKPDFHAWYVKRGLVYLKQNDYALASADFDEALRLRPDHVEARFNRALARLGQNRCPEAIADLEMLIRQGHDDARTHFLLAQAREQAGDSKGAARARSAGMNRPPNDEAAWVARAVARCREDPAGAIEDLDRALGCNVFCLAALQSKAHLLAERSGQIEAAVGVLDRAVAFYPENGSLLAARGVLLARLNRNQAARQDAQAALTWDRSAATTYQVAGIYALLSRREPADAERAIDLLASALRSGYGEDLIAADPDLDPLRQRRQFQQLFAALQSLHPASSESPSNTTRRPASD